MFNIRWGMATLSIVAALIGGMIVWSYMTYTITERAELIELKDAEQELAECVTNHANALTEAEKAQATAELLKANSR